MQHLRQNEGELVTARSLLSFEVVGVDRSDGSDGSDTRAEMEGEGHSPF